MSAVKFCINSLFVAIFIAQAIVTNVAGIPVKKKHPKMVQTVSPLMATTMILPKSTRPMKPLNTRDPRFLGKFSFVAGLNLPTPPTMSPIHRNDIIIKQRVPTQYVTTYNFPPSSWGPFAAAVYEPPPIPSFLEDPIGYLVAILNPYNWFNSSFSTTKIPTAITTVVPDKNQDEVYLVVQDRDNEIPNGERLEKVESKIGHRNIDKRKYITRETPFELSTTNKDYSTVSYDEESDTDLIAEETSMEPIDDTQVNKNFQENSRQFPFPWIKTTTTTTTTTTTQRPTYTESRTRSTQPHTRPTQPHLRPTVTERKTSSPVNITLPTQRPNTTSASNSTIGVTTNSTNQTPYPLSNVTYPIYNNGYYYGGRPQNVSHIELTTSKTTNHQTASFNDVNQYLQPYQPNYQDFDEPPDEQAADFFGRSEQLPPLPNNYYDRRENFTFFNMNHNGLNGFKPSFPLYFQKN